MSIDDQPVRLGRRAFLQNGTLVLTAASFGPSKLLADDKASGRVLAVLQGHSHQNSLNEIGGIHYCTLVAMVEGSGAENNGYSVMNIEANSTIHITGFRKQTSYDWDR
ncbi:MAG: hypothetical protein KDA59_06480 [Planctomycetales bacterium]|nr:hypothetical protein [Planctomycetales bacterium]